MPLLVLGFRPFFLLAGIAAVLLPLVWLAVLHGLLPPPAGYGGPVGWHAHEMLFGFTVAVIAGFLLTAVSNWTGHPTLAGGHLAALAALWLLARVLPFVPHSPRWLLAAVDLAFLPLLALAVGVPLLRHGKRGNLVFVPLLLALTAADGLVHDAVLRHTLALASTGDLACLYLVVLLMVLLGGRVIPFFTSRALPGAEPAKNRLLDAAALVSVALLGGAVLLGAAHALVAAIAGAGALVHLLRLGTWHDRRLWRVPLLAVLHAGYAWIAAGFALRAAAALGALPVSLAVHAFTAGAIATLTLGMMTRVILGHTGRPLRTPATMSIAFVVVIVAGVMRALAPVLFPAAYPRLLDASGVLFALAFALFTARMGPMLLAPRVDA